MVNRTRAIGWLDWKDLPSDEQMGWRIPLEIMIDIPHLRKTHPVILVSEYLRLQNLPINYEWANGAWQKSVYHSGTSSPTLHAIQQNQYDDGIVRVDSYNLQGKEQPLTSEGKRMDTLLLQALLRTKKTTLTMGQVRAALSITEPIRDGQIEDALGQAGWVLLHTWAGW